MAPEASWQRALQELRRRGVHHLARQNEGPRPSCDPYQDEVKWDALQSCAIAAPVDEMAGRELSALAVTPGAGVRTLDFPNAAKLHQACGLPMVKDFMRGVNGALIVYGQAGHGTKPSIHEDCKVDESASLVRCMAESVVTATSGRRHEGIRADLSVSYVEICGNDVCDLLEDQTVTSPNSAAGPKLGLFHSLDGSLSVTVKGKSDLTNILERGSARARVNTRKRQTRTVKGNRVPKAHTILVLRLAQHGTEPAGRVVSTLFLADLGSSKRATCGKKAALMAEAASKALAMCS